MELKQKAKDLVDKFYNAQIQELNKSGTTAIEEVELSISKECAIICTQIEYHEKRELLYNLKSCGVNISDEVYSYRLQELIDEEKEVIKQISVL